MRSNTITKHKNTKTKLEQKHIGVETVKQLLSVTPASKFWADGDIGATGWRRFDAASKCLSVLVEETVIAMLCELGLPTLAPFVLNAKYSLYSCSEGHL